MLPLFLTCYIPPSYALFTGSLITTICITRHFVQNQALYAGSNLEDDCEYYRPGFLRNKSLGHFLLASWHCSFLFLWCYASMHLRCQVRGYSVQCLYWGTKESGTPHPSFELKHSWKWVLYDLSNFCLLLPYSILFVSRTLEVEAPAA